MNTKHKHFKINGISYLLNIEYPNIDREWKDEEIINISLLDSHMVEIHGFTLMASIHDDSVCINYLIIPNAYRCMGFGSIFFVEFLNVMLLIERQRNFSFSKIIGFLHDGAGYDSELSIHFFSSFDNYIYDEDNNRVLSLDRNALVDKYLLLPIVQ